MKTMCPLCNHEPIDHNTGRCSVCAVTHGPCKDFPVPTSMWSMFKIVFQPDGIGGQVTTKPVRFPGATSVRYAAMRTAELLGYDVEEKQYALLEAKDLDELNPDHQIREYEGQTLLLAERKEIERWFEG